MRSNVRNFIEIVSKELEIVEPIVEIGSFQVLGQEDLANLRPIFYKKRFLGCDMRPGKGVDRIENVEKLSMDDKSVGTLLILDTMEHVMNCFNAMNEIYRVLCDDGILIMSSVMNFPIHDYPSDYWRFTPAAFKLLMNEFKITMIGFQGNRDFPHTILGIGIKSNNQMKYKDKINKIKNHFHIVHKLRLINKIKYLFFHNILSLKSCFNQTLSSFEIEIKNEI